MTKVAIPGTNQVTDVRTLAMYQEVERLNSHFKIRVTQGSYRGGKTSASAGTHDGGGALDIHAETLTKEQRLETVLDMRRVGFAAWLRTPDQSDWPFHIHAIAIGCSDLSDGALRQVKDYLDGKNGLASHAADDGPGGYRLMTWEKYVDMRGSTPPNPPVDKTVSMTSIRMAATGQVVTDSRLGDVKQFLGFVGPGGLKLIPDYTVEAWRNAYATGRHADAGKYVRYGVTQLQLDNGLTPDGDFGPVTSVLMTKLGGYNITP